MFKQNVDLEKDFGQERESGMNSDDKFVWSILLHLGMRMWGDDDSLKPLPDSVAIDYDVWKEATERMAEIGMNMAIVDVGEGVVLPSHPELAAKGSWGPERMRDEVERLAKMGIEAVPKLNFATCHDAWLGEVQHKVSTPEYYRTCADAIKDVAEIFGRPRLFHIGMDEESDMGIQCRKDYIVKRQGALYWHDVKFFEDEVKRHGARAWMFADESWFNRESFYANCPKSILLSNWYYGRSFRIAEAKWQPPRIKAYADLDAAGFDQVPCATNWYPDYLYAKKGIRANDVNFPLTVAHCRSVIKPERLKGFMMTTWAQTKKDNRDQILHAIDLVGQSMLI